VIAPWIFIPFKDPKNCFDYLLRFSTQFSVGKLSLFAKQEIFLMAAGMQQDQSDEGQGQENVYSDDDAIYHLTSPS
jgi:hypothetical protein